MNHDANHVLWITIFLCVLLCAKQGLQKSVTQTEDPYVDHSSTNGNSLLNS
jgi:hypothetical protein